jgi:putative hydrolase of the HAD superfamily
LSRCAGREKEFDENVSVMKGSLSDGKITAVIFDYGEVLCHRPTDDEFNRLANVYGADRKRFKELWEKNRGAFDRGELSAMAYWSAMAEDAGRKIDRAQLEEVCRWDIDMWANENPEMVEWLRQLRRAGFKTALLSNMHPDMVTHVRDTFDWLDQFDFVAFSADVRMTKPDPAIYRHTLDGLGVKAEHTLFIDDREGNIHAAQALGIHAIRFHSVPQLRRDLEEMGFPNLPGAT